MLALLVLVWIAAQYGLAARALRDLRLRPRVRGGNKVAWALVILAVPIAGPLIYNVYGPVSFLPRSPASGSRRGPPASGARDDRRPGDDAPP